ncbi:MAG: cob(I)yrinic acid a,c-diamide adenosyltransferase, partial [Patescibacteria group bacterium]|nr:cob(I)yrinic acid a,c-diamide adenosyltransferase [Patescibacteria group bacterium]
MRVKKGMIYIFTGEGKGKTSAALGIAMRAVCNNMKVGWVSWYKGKDWDISEKTLPSRMIPKGGLEMYFMGKGFYKLPTDKETPQIHQQAAEAGLVQAEKLIKKVDVLVMDEAIKAIADGLILEKE